jgi:hypothetical protein
MTTDVINFVTDGSSTVRMRWREPYVTEGINRKFLGSVPRGIYRGFRLTTDAAAMTAKVLSDSTDSDHLAVYESTSGYSTTVRRTGGDFTVSLAAYPSTVVYLAIYTVYSTATTTASVLRIYTEAEYLVAGEKPDLVVLGRVSVPAAGVIADTSITTVDRVEPWREVAPGAVNWVPLVRGGRMDCNPVGVLDTIIPVLTPNTLQLNGANWSFIPGSGASNPGTAVVYIQDSDVPLIGYRGLKIAVSMAGAFSFTGGLFKLDGVVRAFPGDRIRVEFWYKVHTTAASLSFGLSALGGATLADPPVLVALKGSDPIVDTVAAGWKKVVLSLELTGTARQFHKIGFELLAATWNTVGAADLLSISGFQVFVESDIDEAFGKYFGDSPNLSVAKFKNRASDTVNGWLSTESDNELWLYSETTAQELVLKGTQHPRSSFLVPLKFDWSGQISAGSALGTLPVKSRFRANLDSTQPWNLLFESVPSTANTGAFRFYQGHNVFQWLWGAYYDPGLAGYSRDTALSLHKVVRLTYTGQLANPLVSFQVPMSTATEPLAEGEFGSAAQWSGDGNFVTANPLQSPGLFQVNSFVKLEAPVSTYDLETSGFGALPDYIAPKSWFDSQMIVPGVANLVLNSNFHMKRRDVGQFAPYSSLRVFSLDRWSGYFNSGVPSGVNFGYTPTLDRKLYIEKANALATGDLHFTQELDRDLVRQLAVSPGTYTVTCKIGLYSGVAANFLTGGNVTLQVLTGTSTAEEALLGPANYASGTTTLVSSTIIPIGAEAVVSATFVIADTSITKMAVRLVIPFSGAGLGSISISYINITRGNRPCNRIQLAYGTLHAERSVCDRYWQSSRGWPESDPLSNSIEGQTRIVVPGGVTIPNASQAAFGSVPLRTTMRRNPVVYQHTGIPGDSFLVNRYTSAFLPIATFSAYVDATPQLFIIKAVGSFSTDAAGELWLIAGWGADAEI